MQGILTVANGPRGTVPHLMLQTSGAQVGSCTSCSQDGICSQRAPYKWPHVSQGIETADAALPIPVLSSRSFGQQQAGCRRHTCSCDPRACRNSSRRTPTGLPSVSLLQCPSALALPQRAHRCCPSDQRVLITYLGSPRSSHRRAYSALIVVPNAFKQG